MKSSELSPPLTSTEREALADGKCVERNIPEGMIVICPRSIITDYGRVTGVDVTYGPNGEDTYFHVDWNAVNKKVFQ